jgi:hypothetical protein
MTPLLQPKQYYRPTRAGELRGQAARLRRRVSGLRTLRQIGDKAAVCVCLLPLPILFIAAPGAVALPLMLDALALGILTLVSGLCEAFVVPLLEGRALAREREAEALEREHQARYSTDPLPPAGEPPLLP